MFRGHYYATFCSNFYGGPQSYRMMELDGRTTTKIGDFIHGISFLWSDLRSDHRRRPIDKRRIEDDADEGLDSGQGQSVSGGVGDAFKYPSLTKTDRFYGHGNTRRIGMVVIQLNNFRIVNVTSRLE